MNMHRIINGDKLILAVFVSIINCNELVHRFQNYPKV